MNLNKMHSLLFATICASPLAVVCNSVSSNEVNDTFNSVEYFENTLKVPKDGTIVDYSHIKFPQTTFNDSTVVKSLRSKQAIALLRKIK